MEIFKIFTVEIAHKLPNLPTSHKCSRLHGHSIEITIHCRGPVLEPEGWVMDFADLKTAFAPIYSQLDHHYLNEIKGLSNPTSENLAKWIWGELKPRLGLLYQVSVKETCTAGCHYTGTD